MRGAGNRLPYSLMKSRVDPKGRRDRSVQMIGLGSRTHDETFIDLAYFGEDHRRASDMADGWKNEVDGTRRIIVTHPDGHRFFFEFPDKWASGTLPQYKPVIWHGEKPDTPWIEAEAAIAAVTAARAQGWVEKD